jgi:DNA repair protein RadC
MKESLTERELREVSSYHSCIKQWPEGERPREKLAAHGPETLSDAELLAILIGSGVGKITAVDLAKTILSEYRSLRGMASLTYGDFSRFKGIGLARAITITAVFEIGRRVSIPLENQEESLTGPEDVVQRFSPKLRDQRQELFIVALLNSSNKLIRDVIVTKGLLNSSLTHPREVFRQAILESSASVILLHNHPSGNPEPSQEDIAITKQLVEAGKIIGIPVHDHVIIAGDRYTSFAERGLL